MTDNQTLSFHDRRDPRLLSYSGIYQYLNCRHKWRLQNVYGIKARERFRPLDLGSAVHAGLEHYLSEKGTFQAGIDAWEAEQLSMPLDWSEQANSIWDLADITRDAASIARRAIEEINRRGLVTVRHEGVPLVERELILPIDGWDGFAAHIDWIAFDPNERTYWIVDFKTRKTFYDDASEDVNLQNPVYQYVASKLLDLPISGTLTFQIKSAVPSRPKVNKDGTVSRAKIVSDWPTYRAVVVEQGGDPMAYMDMHAYLSAIEWTSVLKAYRSREQVERIWHNVVIPAATEMAGIRDALMSGDPDRRAYGAAASIRNLSQRTCNGCGVRDICLNGLRGWDVISLIEASDVRDATWKLAASDGNL